MHIFKLKSTKMDKNSFKNLNAKFKFIDQRINEVTIKLSDSFSLLHAKINQNLQQKIIENALQDRRDLLLKQLINKRDVCLNLIDSLQNSVFTKSGFQFFNLELNFINNYINTRYVNKKISKIKNDFLVFKPSSLNFEAEKLFGQLDSSPSFYLLEAFKYIHLLSGYLLNNSLEQKIDHEYFKSKLEISKKDAFFQLSCDRYFYFNAKRRKMFITNSKLELIFSKTLSTDLSDIKIRYDNEKIYVFHTKLMSYLVIDSYFCNIYDTRLTLLKKVFICFENKTNDIKSLTVHRDEICVQYTDYIRFYDGCKLRDENKAYFFKLFAYNALVLAFNEEKMYMYNFFQIAILNRLNKCCIRKINVYDCFYGDFQYSMIFDLELSYTYLYNHRRIFVFDSDGNLIFKNLKLNHIQLNLLITLLNSKCMRINFLTSDINIHFSLD